MNNPFATRWTRPGAIAFRFAPGDDLESLFRRLGRLGGQAAILGPHGCGKSTLLATLAVQLTRRGQDVRQLVLDPDGGPLPNDLFHRGGPQPWLLIDGYERLSWRDRLRLRSWRKGGSDRGLVVTAHRRIGLPVLTRLQPSLSTTLALAQTLAGEHARIAPHEIAASFHRHEGNIREVWFDLYDLYERARTRPRIADEAVCGLHARPGELSFSELRRLDSAGDATQSPKLRYL